MSSAFSVAISQYFAHFCGTRNNYKALILCIVVDVIRCILAVTALLRHATSGFLCWQFDVFSSYVFSLFGGNDMRFEA